MSAHWAASHREKTGSVFRLEGCLVPAQTRGQLVRAVLLVRMHRSSHGASEGWENVGSPRARGRAWGAAWKSPISSAPGDSTCS